jgi:putative cell wall-binding protein
LPYRALSIIAAVAVLASSLLVLDPPSAAASVGTGKKVAIIVGPTGSLTSSFRQQGDQIASAASATGATVVKVYSPSATWANVRNAVNGANIVVYLGHGNGYPSPYADVQRTDRVNGWGLNRTTTNGDDDRWDSTMVYCGEKALTGTLTSADGAAQWNYCGGKNGTQGITPAPGFVMIYSGACYSPGASEPHLAPPTNNMALQRVSNYSRPVLTLGAGAYFATYHGAASLVDRILRNPNMSFGDIYHAGRPAGTFTDSAHVTNAGARAWMTQTSKSTVFTYAFAGDPHRTPSGSSPISSSLKVERHAGADRFATAAAVSAAFFSPGVDTAYVATGMNFPDALSGGAAAAQTGGPVLLVTRDAIPAATASELARLKPARITVLGSNAAVSDAVAAGLARYATTGAVQRIAGSDRFQTSAAISAATYPVGVDVAYVATGMNFPDALAGVGASAVSGGPILLVNRDAIPAAIAAELSRLKPARIAVLGSSDAVSDSVVAQLGSYTGGGVSRLAGSDRYGTAVAISNARLRAAPGWLSATIPALR